MQFRLTKDDSADIGFALTCLAQRCIHFSEFKDWIYYVIEHTDAPPAYLFDMLDVARLIDFRPLQIMGWHSDCDLSDQDFDALSGIAFLRNIIASEDRISRDAAIATLRANDDLYAKVKAFFPFIDFEVPVGPDPDQGW